MARLLLLGVYVGCLLATTGVASARSWLVTARGSVFTTQEGRTVPLAGVRVYLMDEDPAFDEELTEGRTDRSGRFRLTGRGGDTQWLGCDLVCSRPDVYVRVELPARPGDPRWRPRTHRTRVHRDHTGVVDLGRIIIPVPPAPPPRARRLVRAATTHRAPAR